MDTLIKISINDEDEIARALERLKKTYPTLDTTELFKLGLSELDRKAELERNKRWTEDLPTLSISKEEATSIAEGRQEILDGGSRKVTAKELLAEALSD